MCFNVLTGPRKVNSRIQTLADLSCNNAPQTVACHPWEPQETVPPILHPTTPARALSPSRSEKSIALQTAAFLTPNSWLWLQRQFREIPAHPRETTSCSDCDLQAAPQMANNLFSTEMKTNKTKNLLRVCCGEALPGEGSCLAPWGVDGEVRSTFFFLLYAATLGKCLQEREEPEQHKITPGKSWQPAKGSTKGEEPHHPLNRPFSS